MAEELGAPAGTRGPDDAYGGERSIMGEVISRGIPFQDRCGKKAARPVGGYVLHAVHRTVDPAGKDRIIERPHKDALPANLVQGHLGRGIALCGDDHFLCPYPKSSEFFHHGLGLCKGELASPCPDFYRHCMYACASAARSWSVCAAERKFVSNCDGGRKMPALNIPCQNVPKAAVSHSFTSR